VLTRKTRVLLKVRREDTISSVPLRWGFQERLGGSETPRKINKARCQRDKDGLRDLMRIRSRETKEERTAGMKGL